MANPRKNLFVFKLKNGIRVLAYRMPSFKSVYFEVKTLGGRAYEPLNKKGIAHFTEHVIGAGTPTLKTNKDIFIYLESLAAVRNLYTNMEFISFESRAPAKHLNKLIALGYETFFKPLFSKESIDIERGAIINETKQIEENPRTKLNRFWTYSRVKKNTLLYNDSLSMLENSKTVQRQDLIAYWQRVANPRNIYLIIEGNFDIKKLQQALNNSFGKEKGKSPPLKFPKATPNDLKPNRVAIHYLPDYSNAYIDLSFTGVNMKQNLRTRIQQTILRNILCGFMSSRLYKLLRLEKGLVYDIDIDASLNDALGLIMIATRVEKTKVNSVLELILRELHAFYKNGPTEQEIASAKHIMNNRKLMKYDDPKSIMEWLGGDFLWEKHVGFPRDHIKMTNSITRHELITTMHRYWGFSRLQICIQGNLKNTAQNRKKYQNLLNRYFPH